MNAAHQEQAAACLQHYFNQQVAEAMPKAIRAQLTCALSLGHWLHMATMRVEAAQFGPLDPETDVPMLGGLCASTLLVLMFDQRQPAAIVAAARDVLLGQYLANEDVQALAIAQANVMARQAVRDLARVQAFTRAERDSLYGDEHAVPGVAPAAQAGRVAPTLCTVLVAVAAAATLVLSACGGGCLNCKDEQPEPRPPVDCAKTPEACK